MKTAFECVPCFVRQAAEALTLCVPDVLRRERLMRRLLGEIAKADWNVMPVTITQRIQRIIRSETGEQDPYRPIKERMNRVALDLLPALISAARRQPEPREAFVRLAIAGNLLDSGAKTGITSDELPGHLEDVWHKPLAGSVAALFRAAEEAGSILYLADNAGEIIFDRFLLEVLPAGKITVAVRGAPVLNDATMEDAETAGIPKVAPVIANGSDAPGTILSECSENFRLLFDRADLVISKGQGNYETLSDVSEKIFFLLTVKCPIIAADIGAPVGSMVVYRRNG
ncbi:MAG: ARMT1-like domain-containing protein [Kiritimatiellae bacterium]|nr:ARMT1-like domain-containing protein [Kiritimatiellia bacterium]